MIGLEPFDGASRALGQNVGDRLLERGAKIGHIPVLHGPGRQSFDRHADPGLEAGKRKIAAVAPFHGTRQIEPRGIARKGRLLHRRATGIAQAQHLGGFVEGLADRIVDGGAEPAVVADPFDHQQLAMTAGHQQQQIGERHIIRQPRRQGMGFQVIDGDKRQAPRGGQGLGGHHADQHAADQPGPSRGGDGIDPVPAVSGFGCGLFQGGRDYGVDLIQMGTGRDLGHHAGEGLMVGQLLMDDVRQNLAPVRYNGGGGFVTAGFNAQNAHGGEIPVRIIRCCGDGRGLYSVAPRSPQGFSTPDPTHMTEPAHSQSLRIGTRGSPLALAQAHETCALIAAAHGDPTPMGPTEIVEIKTTGDLILDRPLADIGGKGLFSKEIDRALLDRRIDLAVHSMKDLETWMPDGIVIAAVLEREDPRDAFISEKYQTLADLPEGAVVGTASVRRQAQILHRRPDLTCVTFRGNVQTRLAKLAEGQADATILACAGLNRLGRSDVIRSAIDPGDMLPAVAQGAVAITCRAGDDRVLELLDAINHGSTAARVTAERAMLEALDGSCRTPIGGLADLSQDGTEMTLRGLVARGDGSAVHRLENRGLACDAYQLGWDLGEQLKSLAGPGFLDDPGPDGGAT